MFIYNSFVYNSPKLEVFQILIWVFVIWYVYSLKWSLFNFTIHGFHFFFLKRKQMGQPMNLNFKINSGCCIVLVGWGCCNSRLAYEQQKCICYSSGGWKYKIKAPAWFCFNESPLPSSSFSSVQSLSHVRLCNSMNCSMPGLPVHHQLLEHTQTRVHWVGDAIQ